jgi:diadenosine tetraphosphate (Ap4A) HIT family hydrolase
MKLVRFLAILLFLAGSVGTADVRNCACDLAKPESLAAKECSLCRAAEEQPAAPGIFFLKDVNPRKPNRLLALPRAHYKNGHGLDQMTPQERTALWTAAIEKAKSLWGDQWGLAMNGELNRTQCHGHIHIGKLLDNMENDNFVIVKGPAEIPVPADGAGLWVHPMGDSLHVHAGEQITETVLMR